MPHTGVGSHDDSGSDNLSTPAEIEVFTHGHDVRVETTKLLEQISPHQAASAGGQEDVPHGVVLTVVDLMGMDTIDHRSALVHAHPDVDEALRVLPGDFLGRNDPRIGSECLFHHQVDGIGIESHIVVAEQVVIGAVHHGGHLVDRGPETTIVLKPADIGGGQNRRHPVGQALLAGVVQHQNGQLCIVLRLERGQRLLEPRTGIVGDDDGDNRRCQRFHQGSEAIGPQRPGGGFLHPIAGSG